MSKMYLDVRKWKYYGFSTISISRWKKWKWKWSPEFYKRNGQTKWKCNYCLTFDGEFESPFWGLSWCRNVLGPIWIESLDFQLSNDIKNGENGHNGASFLYKIQSNNVNFGPKSCKMATTISISTLEMVDPDHFHFQFYHFQNHFHFWTSKKVYDEVTVRWNLSLGHTLIKSNKIKLMLKLEFDVYLYVVIFWDQDSLKGMTFSFRHIRTDEWSSLVFVLQKRVDRFPLGLRTGGKHLRTDGNYRIDI